MHAFTPSLDEESPRNPGDSKKHTPNRLIFSLLLLSQERSAALDMCVASSNATAARGDAAQAAFDRTQYKHQIPDLRRQGILYRPLVWTADGRPHPAVTGIMQCAAHIASSRNGQQMSATSLQHRWNHEIQIAQQSFPTLQLEQNGFSPVTKTELSTMGPGLRRSMEVTQTQGQTPLYQMMISRTSPLSPVNTPHHCSNQTSSRAGLPLRAACSLMCQCVLELDALFEDHGVCSGIICRHPRPRAGNL